MQDKQTFRIRKNQLLTKGVYELVLDGDVTDLVRPGQFIDLSIPGFYLRRPLSICDKTEHSATVLYKTVGQGTKALAKLTAGDTISVLSGLGNGFDIEKAHGRVAIVGGGLGVPPLYWLAKHLLNSGRRPTAVLGFRTASDVFYEREFIALGIETHITTDDGSYGLRGNVTHLMTALSCDYLFCCGPIPMLRALYDQGIPGQFSFEERMGCGFGACMGCTIQTMHGPRRVCKDGPVFDREEILWQN